MELDNPVVADIANPFQDQQLVLKDQLVVQILHYYCSAVVDLQRNQ